MKKRWIVRITALSFAMIATFTVVNKNNEAEILSSDVVSLTGSESVSGFGCWCAGWWQGIWRGRGCYSDGRSDSYCGFYYDAPHCTRANAQCGR